jgi:hypothetical protein
MSSQKQLESFASIGSFLFSLQGYVLSTEFQNSPVGHLQEFAAFYFFIPTTINQEELS